MTSRAMLMRVRRALLPGAIVVAFLVAFWAGFDAGAAIAQQAQTPQQKQKQPPQKAQPKQAQPAPQPKRTPPVELQPAEAAQLEQDVQTCRAGQAHAALERACTNVISKQVSIIGLERVDRGHFFYNRARARISAGKINDAIEDLLKAISDDYNIHVAHTVLGGLYLNLQNFEEARKNYAAALDANDGYQPARLGLALALFQTRDAAGKQDISGAVRELNKAIEAEPLNAELYFRRGEMLSRGSAPDDALKSLDDALRLRPGYVEALLVRSDIHMTQGRRNKALDDLNAIVATNPVDAQLLGSLGNAYLQIKQYTQAIRVCEQALKIDFKNVTAHICLGYAHTNRGNLDEAEKSYERALQWGQTSADAFIGRGYLRKRAGRFANAESDFYQALKIDPKSIDAHRHLISLHTDTGAFDKAFLSFEEANNINGRDPTAHYLRAFARALQGDAAGARRDIEQAFSLRAAPDSDAFLARGTVAYFLNDTANAIKDVREAVKLNGDNGQAHRMLARALLKANDLGGAETSLQRAEQLLPNDWNVMRTWGLLWLARKNYDKAREYFDRSLDLNAAFVEAYVGRGRAYEASRLPELAKAEYQRGLEKLDYDNDGREARDEAKRRLAALSQAAVSAAAPVPAPARPVPSQPAPSEPRVATPPPAPPGDSVMCSMLKSFAAHARDYTGVRINTGCGA